MEDLSYSVDLKGRVVLARVRVLRDVTEAEAYCSACANLFGDAVGRPVLLADHRPAKVYSPAVTDALCRVFRINNDVVDRIAILVSPANAVLQMQLNRVTREAGGSVRRVFQGSQAALDFVGEVLTPAERVVAADFFS